VLGADTSVYVTGYTLSQSFPITPGAYDPTCGCDPVNFIGDGFIARLNAGGSALVYSTFIGGSSDDNSYGVAVGGDGTIFVTGTTYSEDFPVTPGAFQTTCFCPGYDAFVTRLDPASSTLLYSTYIGGQIDDYGNNIVVDASGMPYAAGQSWSIDFPITPRELQSPAIVQREICHCPDAFVTKFDMGAPLMTPTPTATPATPLPTATETRNATSTPIPAAHRLYLPLIVK
jgi:hypothetical protein